MDNNEGFFPNLDNTYKKVGRVSVPKQCWKVVYIKKKNEWIFFLFENDQSNPDGINNNKVLRQDIEKLTGLKFK